MQDVPTQLGTCAHDLGLAMGAREAQNRSQRGHVRQNGGPDAADEVREHDEPPAQLRLGEWFECDAFCVTSRCALGIEKCREASWECLCEREGGVGPAGSGEKSADIFDRVEQGRAGEQRQDLQTREQGAVRGKHESVILTL